MFIYIKDENRLYNLDNELVILLSCVALWLKHFKDDDKNAVMIKCGADSKEALQHIVQYMTLENKCITL